MISKNTRFGKFAKAVAHFAGLPGTFLAALGIIVVWGITGPIFEFNNTWQLVINTGTTIVTFLMVFVIQNAQNRDSIALQLKLDELLRAQKSAHNSLIDLEELEEDELEKIRCEFEKIAHEAREKLRDKQDPFSVFGKNPEGKIT